MSPVAVAKTECQCDEYCFTYGDCCDDYVEFCGGVRDQRRSLLSFHTPTGASMSTTMTATLGKPCMKANDCEYGEFCDYGASICRAMSATGEQCSGVVPCLSGLECRYYEQGSTCEIPCRYSEWSKWSACDQACYKGGQTRTRSRYQGTQCPDPNMGVDVYADLLAAPMSSTPMRRQSNYMGSSMSMGSSSSMNAGAGGSSPMETQRRACNTNVEPARPVMNTPAPMTVSSNAGTVEMTLTGIKVASDLGPGGTSAGVRMTAVSSSSAVIRPTVRYGGSGSSGVLSFEVVAGRSGKADVEIEVQDECNVINMRFPITVTADMTDCKVAWSEWTCCSQSCRPSTDPFGQGVRTRGTYVQVEPKDGGRACPAPREERQRCGSEVCPVNCEASWNEWSPCSATCGEGTKTRSANVVVAGTDGGASCGALSPQQELCRSGVPCASTAQSAVVVNKCDQLPCTTCLGTAGCDYDIMERRCAPQGQVNGQAIAISLYQC
jgi:hypothetical protein